MPALGGCRTEGSATFCMRGLLLLPTVGNEVVRELTAGAMTKRSAEGAEGGERGSDVCTGRLPGDVDNESRCWFLISVGVKSGPSSDRSLDDSKDSSASISKRGIVRYVTDNDRLPVGCVIDAKVCVSFASGEAPRAGGASMKHFKHVVPLMHLMPFTHQNPICSLHSVHGLQDAAQQ